MPTAYGVLNLNAESLGKMTIAEYFAKLSGFIEYKQQENEFTQKLMLWHSWHIGYFSMIGFNDPKKYPKLNTILKD